MADSNVRIVACHDPLLLRKLQLDCLGGDEPLPADKGWWWVAYQDGLPVAFCCLKETLARGDGYLARAGVIYAARGQRIQRKLVQVRERKARQLGFRYMLCDTALINHPSSNSLIACGYKLYEPRERWAFTDGLYWRKEL